MLVLTENTYEKPRNRNYSRSSKVSFKRNSTKVKVIANRITPYCGDISKNEKEIIKTRKFLKDYRKIKYRYLYSRKNINNAERGRKIKLHSVEKRWNLFQLERFSKNKKKKNQVIVNRINYNVILKKSRITNFEHETNPYLLHLKGKKDKIHNKRRSRKYSPSEREITLDNRKDIDGKDVHNLYKVSKFSKIKTKRTPYLDNKNGIWKLNYAYKINSDISLHLPLVNNDNFFKAYANGSISKNSLVPTCSERKLTTSSLVDSIISLSNQLNKTNEKTKDSESEYDKSVLHYVNKILCDNHFHYDISPNVNKNKIKELKCKIKKYNDIPNFYFRKLFRNIELKHRGSHKKSSHCYPSGRYNYDSDYNVSYSNKFRFINFEPTSDNPKVSRGYFGEEQHSPKKLESISKTVKPKKKRSIETEAVTSSVLFRFPRDVVRKSLVCNNNDDNIVVGDVGHAKDGSGRIKHCRVNSFKHCNHGDVKRSSAHMHREVKCTDRELCIKGVLKQRNEAVSCDNSLHHIKKCRTVFVDAKEHTFSKGNNNNNRLNKGPFSNDAYSNKLVPTDRRRDTHTPSKKVTLKCEKGKMHTCKMSTIHEFRKEDSDVHHRYPFLCEKVYMLNRISVSEHTHRMCVVSDALNSRTSSNSNNHVDNQNDSEKVKGSYRKRVAVRLNSIAAIENEKSSKCNDGGTHGDDRSDSTRMNMHERNFNMNNVKRNDSFINVSEDDINGLEFSNDHVSIHPRKVACNENFCIMHNSSNSFAKSGNVQKDTFSKFGGSLNRHNSDTRLREDNKKNVCMGIFSMQNDVRIESTKDERTNPPKERLYQNTLDTQNAKKGSEALRGIPTELKSLRSSVYSLSSTELVKTPQVSNIENNNYHSFTSFFPKGVKSSFCIFNLPQKKERLSNRSPLIVASSSKHRNDLNLKSNSRLNILLLKKDIKMNNDDITFFDDEALMKCLKENPAKFRTNEEYERYCNEDKILNPDYKPFESKRLGEQFLKREKEKFASFTHNNFPYETSTVIPECGNSCFKNDNGGGFGVYSDHPNKSYLNSMQINVYNNGSKVGGGNSGGSSIYGNNYINSINREYYMQKGTEHHSNDIFIKYYEKYANKDNERNEAKKFNYTDCYDFKNSLLNGLSREDSFGSDEDLKNDESDVSFLKDSLNSFDNLESTEKKYEEILRDFNGKIPLLHKVLKPLPVKNRSNNFDICLYLLQKHGGDLNNEENICILRDKDIVEHSAIYDTKKGCIKSNITNVTNIKLYHPKWYNKKKIVERLKEQSCYNPFTIFGSAPSLLDFDEVFDKDVYNKFVSRNSRKNHSLLRILAKQKVISNLNDKITDKEWPQVHAYLKKRWSKETNIELNWACDPLLYEELEWYLSTNNEYLNMTDKVADIEVCYCPTLDPSSYYAWNDSRVIYTNLCYNKSKEDIDVNNNTGKEKYSTNKSTELKNSDKKSSFRKRASGCEHLMFQQNVMKQKNLSKKRKKLLRRRKLLREKRKLAGTAVGSGSGNSGGSFHQNTHPYLHENSGDYGNDKFRSDLKSKDDNNGSGSGNGNGNGDDDDNENSSYYPAIFVTKNKKSVYQTKNYDEDVIPIMTVNTSLYRHNMDNKYNCNNTAYDYIKNKDNTIKFFASPKKLKKKNSLKKSVNNSECFYFLNSSMINSDNIYADDNGNNGNNGDDRRGDHNDHDDNHLGTFDSRDSMDCNHSASVYSKNMFNVDDVRSKEEISSKNAYISRCTSSRDNFEKNGTNECELLRPNDNNCSKNYIYEFKSSSKSAYNVNKNISRNVGYYMTHDNDNIMCRSNFNMNTKSDFPQSFHMNSIKNGNYGNGDNIQMSIFKNIRMDERNYHKYNHKGAGIDTSGSNDIGCCGIGDFGQEHFNKNRFAENNYYENTQMKFVSNDFNKLQSSEISRSELNCNTATFEKNLPKMNLFEKSLNEKKINTKQLKEKYANVCKGQSGSLPTVDDDHNHDHVNGDKFCFHVDISGEDDDKQRSNLFECNYDKTYNNKYGTNKSSKIIGEYFHNKSAEVPILAENKKKIKVDTPSESQKRKEMVKNGKDVIPENNILKLTQKNIDRKNIIEKKIKSNMPVFSKKNNADVSLSSFHSKRLSNSNMSANENRKIRKYTNKMCREGDNASIEQSENSKGQNNKMGSIETPSSRTSDTSMSSAFKMATSVFKKLF
ncbi:conserved Plasmodium protein, unknown function [Plasmodium ovale wallikeri]|uniref:Inner centromere protein ARK-binding domain-containing protein n=1 Tax=Plasmodium ovale wallikeri TaxID=864142 RepID=A0A1A8ZC97_PLAOA|nr:conserved Plasmodium protein, unknown function [Plasmodium ovale wallikeri]